MSLPLASSSSTSSLVKSPTVSYSRLNESKWYPSPDSLSEEATSSSIFLVIKSIM